MTKYQKNTKIRQTNVVFFVLLLLCNTYTHWFLVHIYNIYIYIYILLLLEGIISINFFKVSIHFIEITYKGFTLLFFYVF